MRYLVLDFEATTKNEGNQMQEIIQFPIILLDETGDEIDSLNIYCNPQFTVLDTLCKKLTRISRSKINRHGIPFHEALKQVENWLRKHEILGQDGNLLDACWVTCGSWDLGYILPTQCEHYGIVYPPYFDEYVDIKKIFADQYMTKVRNLEDMLTRLGLVFRGNPHDGYDDASNISDILRVMVREGTMKT